MSNSVHRFWDLPSSDNGSLGDWKTSVFEQIRTTTSTLFEAAAREQMIHFQTLPNAFEVFGVDWLVDEAANVWLLEVNAFPDFKQSGDASKGLVADFWKAAIQIAVAPFFGVYQNISPIPSSSMVKALDIDLGRR